MPVVKRSAKPRQAAVNVENLCSFVDYIPTAIIRKRFCELKSANLCWHNIYYTVEKIITVMDALIIILGIILAYVAFVTITIGLARIFFPKINIDDSELVGDGLVKFADTVKKKVRSKMSSGPYSRKYLYR